MPKISQLPEDTSPATTSFVPHEDVNTTTAKKVKWSNLISMFFKNVLSSDMATALSGQQNMRNLLINGSMRVWQRGTTFTTPNSATYLVDRWYQQQVANGAWTFSQDSSTAPTNSLYALKAVNVTANDQCMIIQALEQLDTVPLRGQNVSLSFWAKTQSSQISNLRATVIQWAGTADSITKAVVNTWHGNGTDPTLATNWSAAQGGTNAALTNSWQQFKIENIPINSSCNNIAVIIWVDDSTITAGDTFWLSQVQLNLGSKCMAFTPTTFAEDLAKCQRYYVRIRDTGQGYSHFATGFVTGINFQVATPVSLRTTPTVTASGMGHRFGGADYTLSSVSVQNMTNGGVALNGTSSGSPGNGNVSGIWTNSGALYFDSEL